MRIGYVLKGERQIYVYHGSLQSFIKKLPTLPVERWGKLGIRGAGRVIDLLPIQTRNLRLYGKGV